MSLKLNCGVPVRALIQYKESLFITLPSPQAITFRKNGPYYMGLNIFNKRYKKKDKNYRILSKIKIHTQMPPTSINILCH